MATDHSTSSVGERLKLRDQAWPLYSAAWIVGGLGIMAAVVIGFLGDPSLKSFFFAYLVSFAFFLSLALGGLYFVIMQHLVKAAWSVNVRRLAECLASSMPIVAVLAIPIVVPVLLHQDSLYPWADLTKMSAAHKAEHAQADVKPETKPQDVGAKPAESGDEEITGFKKLYLNPVFWTLRIVAYFVIWSFIGIWYWQQSVRQDSTGDIELTAVMQRRSPAAMIAFALTLTLASFDLFMSLDPYWSSTIFGVYFFAGCVVSTMATLIVSVLVLQAFGYLRDSVTIEHFHDLGKLLFGFTFFWGYIAFSQYMLMWYANLPEETHWFVQHGASQQFWPTGTIFPVMTPPDPTWSIVCVVLLFGNLLIPFAGLLSRHVKRTPMVLGFWAVWLLVFHFVDLFWIVMPQMGGKFHFGIVEVAAFLGIGGVFLAFVLSRMAQSSLRPTQDPRLDASLAFQNV